MIAAKPSRAPSAAPGITSSSRRPPDPPLPPPVPPWERDEVERPSRRPVFSPPRRRTPRQRSRSRSNRAEHKKKPAPPWEGQRKGHKMQNAADGPLFGTIRSWDPTLEYGFIRSDSLGDMDIYFHKSRLPSDLQVSRREDLLGVKVECEIFEHSEGKMRAESVTLLEWPSGKSTGKGSPAEEKGKGKGRRERKRRRHGGKGDEKGKDGPPPPPLGEDRLAEMRNYLEEHDGVMDFSRFSTVFNVKKAQVKPHFDLVPDDPNRKGGVWQITLPGVKTLPREELETRDRDEIEKSRQNGIPPPPPPPPRQASDGVDDVYTPDDMDDDCEDEEALDEEADFAILEPSTTLRLFGSVVKWDAQSGSGSIDCEGLGEVTFKRDGLPPEVQKWKASYLERAEVTFELDSVNGVQRAMNVHILLQPDGEGGWQTRRS